jgi:hypothetical protein
MMWVRSHAADRAKPGAGMTRLIILLTGLMAVSASVFAQKAKAPAEKHPLDALDSELGRLGHGSPAETSKPNPAPDGDVQKLNDKIERMQEELVQKSDAIRALEDENEKLRQALRLRFSGGKSAGGLPPVPIPNRELLESVLKEAAPFQERQETAGGPSNDAEAYTVVDEWGRSPEIAKSLPGNVASLIGMALAVKPGTQEAELRRLGEDLRKNYESYDNINIEVFDDVEAARTFAHDGKSDPNHRVLSITKFLHSGRDSVVLYRDGRPVGGGAQ